MNTDAGCSLSLSLFVQKVFFSFTKTHGQFIILLSVQLCTSALFMSIIWGSWYACRSKVVVFFLIPTRWIQNICMEIKCLTYTDMMERSIEDVFFFFCRGIGCPGQSGMSASFSICLVMCFHTHAVAMWRGHFIYLRLLFLTLQKTILF